MRRLICFVFLAFFYGCGSNTIKFDCKPDPNKRNKYCILLLGGNSDFYGKSCPTDQLDGSSIKRNDCHINNDIGETITLAKNKGYSTTTITNEGQFTEVVDLIAKQSDDSTQLLVAMSGECDDKGFIFNLVHTTGGMSLVPPGMKLSAKQCIAHLGLVKGTKAVVINGCQSGCFADAARADKEFKGVVIASCAVGYATTQCERTSTSAVYAGFLGLYQDDPKAVKNLATEPVSAGFWWENFRHKVSDIGAGGLPISYDIIRYSTADYLF